MVALAMKLRTVMPKILTTSLVDNLLHSKFHTAPAENKDNNNFRHALLENISRCKDEILCQSLYIMLGMPEFKIFISSLLSQHADELMDAGKKSNMDRYIPFEPEPKKALPDDHALKTALIKDKLEHCLKRQGVLTETLNLSIQSLTQKMQPEPSSTSLSQRLEG